MYLHPLTIVACTWGEAGGSNAEVAVVLCMAHRVWVLECSLCFFFHFTFTLGYMAFQTTSLIFRSHHLLFFLTSDLPGVSNE